MPLKSLMLLMTHDLITRPFGEVKANGFLSFSLHTDNHALNNFPYLATSVVRTILSKMCGILFTLSTCPSPPSPSHVSLVSLRGPDSTETYTVARGSKNLTFTSSLLSVRGTDPTPQPLVDPSTGSVLCWNGEAWCIRGAPIAHSANDTREVFEVLLAAPGGNVQDVLRDVEGEFSFVFYDARAGVCWFGRDWAGRRSLVMRTSSDGLEVASVGDGIGGSPWNEVEAGGVWKIDVEKDVSTWVTERLNGNQVCTIHLCMSFTD